LTGRRRFVGSWVRAALLGTALVVVTAWGGLAEPTADAPSAAATDEARGPQFGYALAHEVMSPYCPGRTLSACPSEQAAELRQWILLQEAAGATREEVLSALEARFGEQIRSAPKASGWGLAAWALPGGAVLIGGLLVVVVLRRMVAPDAPAPDAGADAGTGPAAPPKSSADAELERLVDAELAAGER